MLNNAVISALLFFLEVFDVQSDLLLSKELCRKYKLPEKSNLFLKVRLLASCQKGKSNNPVKHVFPFLQAQIVPASLNPQKPALGAAPDPNWGVPWFFPTIMVY